VVTIRAARPEDEASLARVDALTWTAAVSPAPAPPAGTAFFGERTRPEDVLVAEVDGDVAGYAKLGQAMAISSDEHVLELGGLAVEDARARGARKLSLRVLSPNAGARRLYEACGFIVEGVLQAEFLLEGRFVDDALMARHLVPPGQQEASRVPQL